MPAEFFGKGVGPCGPSASDAVRRQHSIMRSDEQLPEAQAPCVVSVLSTLMESPAQLYGFGGFTVEKKEDGLSRELSQDSGQAGERSRSGES